MKTDMEDRGRDVVARIRRDERKRLSARVCRICRELCVPKDDVPRFLEFAGRLLVAWPGAHPA